MTAILIRREPIAPPVPPPSPLDAVLATLARDGVHPTRTAVLRAALDAGHDAEFAAYLAGRAGALDALDASPLSRFDDSPVA